MWLISSCCPPDNSHSLLSTPPGSRPAGERQVRLVANHIEQDAPPQAGYDHFPLRVFADGLAGQSSPRIILLIVIIRTGQKIHTMTSLCRSYLSSRRFDHSWDTSFFLGRQQKLSTHSVDPDGCIEFMTLYGQLPHRQEEIK
jgi:hypothetical protein